jgi:TolB-like protein/DNA-binding winged helix-turn-helix (wHTH) protein/Flp pilus assembly protein TadD
MRRLGLQMNSRVESPANKTLERGFELGTVRIDPSSGAARGPGGIEKLDPKVMAVLVVLAESAGRVVSRDALISRIWPDVVVGDEVLSRCIYELRRHLVQAAGDDKFRDAIETLPKRGYRLNIPVSSPAPEVVPRRGRPWALLVVAASVVVVAAFIAVGKFQLSTEPARDGAGANSIAVLPFVDMSPEKDQAYLADGFAEEILNRLAQSKDLRVIARTSSFALRDPALNVTDIAGRLGVSHVLEGSVRKSDNTVRITAQLIAASNSSHVWSETYDRHVTDLLAVQAEIANAVATALEATLAPESSAAGLRPNQEAYEKFLQAEFFYYRRGAGDIPRAMGYYEEAVSLDPRFARAWAALSGAYSMMAGQSAVPTGQSPSPADQSYRERQRQAALKAVELEPNLAVAHSRLSAYYFEMLDIEKDERHRAMGERHRDIARKLDPNDPSILTHDIELAVDRNDFETAIRIQRGLAARDPLSSVIRHNLAVLLLANEQFDAALAEFRKVQEIRPPGEPEISNEIAHALILLRRFDEASEEAAKVNEGEARDQALAFLYAGTGRTKEADQALVRLLDTEDAIFDTVRIAEVYAYRGMADRAFETLHRRDQSLVREHGAQSGYVWYLRHEARLSPFLKALHGDPRWGEFVRDRS